mmetsp:Transcript_1257/g.3664  ORF Transcript_1257/g.3664 Transcript_1257/m.3664 type:complete len:109 (+) Transcript_1257:80-406(+)
MQAWWKSLFVISVFKAVVFNAVVHAQDDDIHHEEALDVLLEEVSLRVGEHAGGKMSLTELLELAEDDRDEEILADILQHADKDGDGKISREELPGMMKLAPHLSKDEL